MKVLIADDLADARHILRTYMERQGWEVIEAGNGQEGLELAKIHKPTLVISDALMPGMDGFQFLRKLRQDETLKNTPFIFYSAVYQDEKDHELAVSLGADAFIAKPKRPDDFWKEVQAILTDYKFTARPAKIIEKEDDYLREYANIVAAKLEEKVRELEHEITSRVKTERALQDRVEELEKFYKMAVDRELKMKALKEENERLKAELSRHK